MVRQNRIADPIDPEQPGKLLERLFDPNLSVVEIDDTELIRIDHFTAGETRDNHRGTERNGRAVRSRSLKVNPSKLRRRNLAKRRFLAFRFHLGLIAKPTWKR